MYNLAKDIQLHTVWQSLPCTVHGMFMVNNVWGIHISPQGTMSHPMY